jgi:hypothetical protein
MCAAAPRPNNVPPPRFVQGDNRLGGRLLGKLGGEIELEPFAEHGTCGEQANHVRRQQFDASRQKRRGVA